jgi:hypothetical protein
MRFMVLMVANVKVTAFWDGALCNRVEIYQSFRGTCSLHRQGDKKPKARAAYSSL